jgi:hypothetical protein
MEINLTIFILFSYFLTISGFIRNPFKIHNVGSKHYLSFSDFPDTLTFPIATGVPIAIILSKLIGYARVQYTTASMVGVIPKNSKVVEIDAVDGKNIFYLPKGVEYTAIMNPGEDDPKKVKEKSRINEQLILECIGKANM